MSEAQFAEQRSSRLPSGAPLDYEPTNELGVIYLFSQLARKRYGLHVEAIQAAFPDCIAYRNNKKVRIEFEYKSRNFLLHGHNPEQCDWLVCWAHNWPAVPENIRVIELRREYGLGFNVWFQPVSGEYRDVLSRIKYDNSWSVPSLAIEGDLLLFYRTSPDKYVQDIFKLAGPVLHCQAGWKPGKDWMGPIRRVCSLKSPIHLSDMRNHRVIKDAGFVRGGMRGRFKASEYWAELYRLIMARNPSVEHALKAFGPERIG